MLRDINLKYCRCTFISFNLCRISHFHLSKIWIFYHNYSARVVGFIFLNYSLDCFLLKKYLPGFICCWHRMVAFLCLAAHLLSLSILANAVLWIVVFQKWLHSSKPSALIANAIHTIEKGKVVPKDWKMEHVLLYKEVVFYLHIGSFANPPFNILPLFPRHQAPDSNCVLADHQPSGQHFTESTHPSELLLLGLSCLIKGSVLWHSGREPATRSHAFLSFSPSHQLSLLGAAADPGHPGDRRRALYVCAGHSAEDQLQRPRGAAQGHSRRGCWPWKTNR